MNETANTQDGRKWLPKPNNIINVPTNLSDFFKWWCIFLRPFVNLTDKEVEVVASFLRQRNEISKTTTDQNVIDTMLMSNPVKAKVMEECKLSQPHFYVMMSNFRKNKVIVDNHLNPKLVPNIRPTDDGMFQLLVLFKDTNA